jgi:hypothetical protein
MGKLVVFLAIVGHKIFTDKTMDGVLTLLILARDELIQQVDTEPFNDKQIDRK